MLIQFVSNWPTLFYVELVSSGQQLANKVDTHLKTPVSMENWNIYHTYCFKTNL